jgi:hypothetical protein
MARERRVSSAGLRQSGACPLVAASDRTVPSGPVRQTYRRQASIALWSLWVSHPHWGVESTVIGLATRGIMMIESCSANDPTEK